MLITNLIIDISTDPLAVIPNEAGLVASLVQYHNISWPLGAYEDLFIPVIDFDPEE
jgi:hypothetical protein